GERLWNWCRRKPALAVSLALIAALLLIVTVGSPLVAFRIEGQRRLAEEAGIKEVRLRKQSDLRAYAADMKLVERALELNNLDGALKLLGRHRPAVPGGMAAPSSSLDSGGPASPGAAGDLRGWEWRYSWDRCRSDALSVFCTTSSHVCDLAISHDGTLLAIGVGGTGVSLRELATAKEIARLPASGHTVRAAFSPAAPVLAYSET